MKPCLNLFLQIFILVVVGQAQPGFMPLSATYVSSEGLQRGKSSALTTAWYAASLADLSENSVGVTIEQRYGLSELRQYQIATAIRTSAGNFGLNVNGFGVDGSRQFMTSLSYGRRLGEQFVGGAALHMISLRQNSIYGNDQLFTASVSVLFRPSETVSVAISAFNPFRAQWNKQEGLRYPAAYRAGFGWHPSEKLLIGLELQHQSELGTQVLGTLHYTPVPLLTIRAGVAAGAYRWFSGVSIFLKRFRLDVSAGFHQQLGFIPGTILLASFGEKVVAPMQEGQ